MTPLPRAILFDLDDTIISFGRRRLLLQEVAEGFAARFHPCTPAMVADVLDAQFAAFWRHAERNREWRQRLPEARRFVVEEAFATLQKAGATALDRDFAHTFGERFNAYREAQVREPDKVESWTWYPLHDLPSPLFAPTQLGLDAHLGGRVIHQL